MQIMRDGVLITFSPAEAAAFEAARPVVTVPVPGSITRRQFLLALLATGFISGEEAEAAATVGALPAAVDGLFAALPEEDALAARITWASMGTAERDSPLLAVMIGAGLATPMQVDELFRLGAAL